MLRFPGWLVIPVYRPHKCDKLPRYDPIKVPILDLLIVFILSGIEILEAIPPQLCRYL
jgi:hypothetical protein